MASIYDALNVIHEKYKTPTDVGAAFERAALYYLRNAPEWRNRVENVQLWNDSELCDGHDKGIDLVAKDRYDGSYWAIQCKCYEKSVSYKATSTFFTTALSNSLYDHYLLITTDCNITKNVRKLIDKSQGKSIRLTTANMDSSDLDWQSFISGSDRVERRQYNLRPDQQEALSKVLKTFETNDRCRMIMACGTGKTFVSFKIAEAIAPQGMILFCAPSIALVSQACAAFNSFSSRNMRFLTVCSDSKASNAASKAEKDSPVYSLADLPYPATTDAQTLVQNYLHMQNGGGQNCGFTVIFTTYQSMPVIAEAHQQGLPAFDLIICDEAHRTTGVAEETLPAKEASVFQLVHHEEHIHGKKRLYMTATPRIYSMQAKNSKHGETYLFTSMDDENIYGPEAYRLPFDRAVEQGLLSDYKVVVLAVREEEASNLITPGLNDDGEMDLDQACKILGCYKGLVYHGERSACNISGSASCSEYGEESDRNQSETFEPIIVADFNRRSEVNSDIVRPLRRAVGFCHSIKASKQLNEIFNSVVENYCAKTDEKIPLKCSLKHVDGTMDSNERHRILRWLAEDNDDLQSCRLLTNARCLAEGVDVPALDAVIFFSPRKSKVDIIQAVGRVMRTFKDKRYGYIILPVCVPSGMTAEEALSNNDNFAVIWDVLQALRSHDNRLETVINSATLQQKNVNSAMISANVGLSAEDDTMNEQLDLNLPFDVRLQKAIYTQLVKKCGDRVYWEKWTTDVTRIAQEHIKQLNELIASNSEVKTAFDEFLQGLQEILNPAISRDQAVEMVTQHMITIPIFDVLFGNFRFKDSNPVSVTIEKFLDCLPSREVTDNKEDQQDLRELYDSVARRAKYISSAAGRQQLIKELYNKFFKLAFPSTQQKLGIVYTPNEIVEFILQFSNLVIKEKFGKSLADTGVHILDGFAGTGTFIAQLIGNPQLIPDGKLAYKYLHELHSNEILLLAYYIMVVNIEQVYHSRLKTNNYQPFPGALLTDTFQMAEKDDNTLDNEVFSENHARVRLQKEQKISVIISNPPYSPGQKSANDNNQNDKYPKLDKRIAETYANMSRAGLKNKIYDTYIRAFRWASDRLGNKGVICFVSNAGWLRGVAMDGFRKCLSTDFSEVYIFDLRGNQIGTKGEESRLEGGKVFAEGSRAPIAVSLLVKDDREGEGRIFYYDVGDYLTREQKLKALLEAAARCAEGLPVSEILPWRELTPDKYNDWLDHRTDEFNGFAPIAINKGKEPLGIFDLWSLGIATNRDAWVYNYNKVSLQNNIKCLIERTNAEIERINSMPDAELTYNAKLYSWTDGLKSNIKKNKAIVYCNDDYLLSAYRPFCLQYLYYSKTLNERTGQMPKLFPLPSESGAGFCVPASPEQISLNLGTMLPESDRSARERLKNVVFISAHNCVFASKLLPDLELVHHGQCFPFYRYEPIAHDDIFSSAVKADFVRHEAVTDQALSVFKQVYPYAYAQRPKSRGGAGLNKLDIFCYIYAVLHHPEYKERFADNLNKDLPRIPFVGCAGCASEQEVQIKASARFEAFAEIGRQLLQININYEEAEPYKVKEVWSKKLPEGVGPENPGPVVKLAWAKRKGPESGKSDDDYSRLIYNANLTLEGLPERAQDYTINGRSAIDWLIEYYQEDANDNPNAKAKKATGIKNNANEFAPDNPRYILDLIKKVLTVAVRSLDLIGRLGDMPLNEQPQPEFYPQSWRSEL